MLASELTFNKTQYSVSKTSAKIINKKYTNIFFGDLISVNFLMN